MKKRVLSLIVVMFMVTNAKNNFSLESTSFKHNELISVQYTCDGANISPELHWYHAPENTKSFALIVDDPDAPTKQPFVHWVIFNIPAKISALPENIPSSEFTQGKNSFETTKPNSYGGPCPPSGTHRYFFKLYALDTVLNLLENAHKEDVVKAMEGHILAQAELIGLYKRQKQ